MSDPPFYPGYRPQGRPGGSLTPRISPSLSAWNASPIQPCNVGQISRADDVEFIVSGACVFARGNSCVAGRRGTRMHSCMAGRGALRNVMPTVRRCRRSEPDHAGPLRRVKASLAPLAADAALTRLSRSLHRRSYRSDGQSSPPIHQGCLNRNRHGGTRLAFDFSGGSCDSTGQANRRLLPGRSTTTIKPRTTLGRRATAQLAPLTPRRWVARSSGTSKATSVTARVRRVR